MRGSFGKTEIGALIAGKTSKGMLARPTRINLNPELSVMSFSFRWFDVW